MEYNDKAIVRALIYSSFFHYPLTKEELWQYAISEKPLNKKNFFSALTSRHYYESKDSFYFLPKDEEFVPLRITREKIASKKLQIARKVVSLLGNISTIQFIGISGSLSMGNTKEEDDIDLFIITKRNTVWFTRVCILFLLEILGKRRKKYATRVNNKICLNLLIEESHIGFPKEMQNLYTAHEVAQVKPLFNRNATYEKFIDANRWVETYLPNALDVAPLRAKRGNPDEIASSSASRRTPRNDVHTFISFLNFLAKKGQLWYMKRHRTSEIITDTVLAFYTNEMQKNVLEAYQKKIKKYEI